MSSELLALVYLIIMKLMFLSCGVQSFLILFRILIVEFTVCLPSEYLSNSLLYKR